MTMQNVNLLIFAIVAIACFFVAVERVVKVKEIRDQLSGRLRLAHDREIGLMAQNKLLAHQLTGFNEMKEQQDIIAIWLRENCKRQIATGLHNGRGLGEIVTGYLSAHFVSLPSETHAGFWCQNCSLARVSSQGDTCRTCLQLIAYHDGQKDGQKEGKKGQ